VLFSSRVRRSLFSQISFFSGEPNFFSTLRLNHRHLTARSGLAGELFPSAMSDSSPPLFRFPCLLPLEGFFRPQVSWRVLSEIRFFPPFFVFSQLTFVFTLHSPFPLLNRIETADISLYRRKIHFPPPSQVPVCSPFCHRFSPFRFQPLPLFRADDFSKRARPLAIAPGGKVLFSFSLEPTFLARCFRVLLAPLSARLFLPTADRQTFPHDFPQVSPPNLFSGCALSES